MKKIILAAMITSLAGEIFAAPWAPSVSGLLSQAKKQAAQAPIRVAAVQVANIKTVQLSAVAPASKASVFACTATCLITGTGGSYAGAGEGRHLVQGTGATRAEALINLKAACDQKLAASDMRRKESELATTVDISPGNSWDGNGRTNNVSFDANKACAN